MRDNPKGGDLDPAIDVRKRCKNSPSVLSYIGKRKEGRDCGSEVGTVPLRKNLMNLEKERITFISF